MKEKKLFILIFYLLNIVGQQNFIVEDLKHLTYNMMQK